MSAHWLVEGLPRKNVIAFNPAAALQQYLHRNDLNPFVMALDQLRIVFLNKMKEYSTLRAFNVLHMLPHATLSSVLTSLDPQYDMG